jgi:hypothetical protein
MSGDCSLPVQELNEQGCSISQRITINWMYATANWLSGCDVACHSVKHPRGRHALRLHFSPVLCDVLCYRWVNCFAIKDFFWHPVPPVLK